MFDEDIKIANIGGKGTVSKHEKTHSVSEEYNRESAKGNTVKAKILGQELALKIADNLNTFTVEDEDSGNDEIAIQRGVLMTFAATVILENEIESTVVSQAAKNSFNSELEKLLPELSKAVNDSGAFSFYYLAYRRGTEVDRRIGQTFAMLCAHDGDPIYQELGEAIYCWFLSTSSKMLKSSGIL